MFILKNGIKCLSPKSLMLILTQDCQLRCSYCFEEHKHNEIMTFDVAKRAIDYIYENAMIDNKVPAITLFGGEPMLMWDTLIVPIIEYIRSKYHKFRISMTTNGLLLNEERLNYLLQHDVAYMLSIDGSENGQNATRKYINGNNTFEDLVPIIDMILKYRPNTPFRMTTTPSNIQYLFESVEWFDKKGVKKLRSFPNVYEEWPDESLLILDAELKKYNDYLYHSFSSNRLPLVFDIYEYYFKKSLVDQYEKLNGLCRTSYFCETCTKCGIGLLGNFMCNYKGDLFTCDRYMIPESTNPCYVGNIYDGINLERINSLFDLCDKEMHNPNLDCDKCSLYNICSGGCIPVNYQVTGDFMQPPNSYCKYNQIVYKNVLALLNKFENEKTCEYFKQFFQKSVRTERLYVG